MRKRKLEFIDPHDLEPTVDHRGRSRPLYRPTQPIPSVWRPNRAERIGLGAFPGVRLMALRSFRAGLPYAALGLVALAWALHLAMRFDITVDEIDRLGIDRRWLLLHASLILAIVVAFELLRLGSALEDIPAGGRLPRMLAALLVPSVAAAGFSAVWIEIWPRMLEASFVASSAVALGALPPSLASAMRSSVGDEQNRWRLARAVAIALVCVLACAAIALAVLSGARAALARAALDAGFCVVPRVLE